MTVANSLGLSQPSTRQRLGDVRSAVFAFSGPNLGVASVAMCGRITDFAPWRELYEYYNLFGSALNLAPNYNVCPTNDLSAIGLNKDNQRSLVRMRWGMPSPKNAKIPLINARSETVHQLPTFKQSYEKRRCVVAVSGFYEWQRKGAQKTPIHFYRADQAPLTFAGIWTKAKLFDGEERHCVSILTTGPNQIMTAVHDRLPVILAEDCIDHWLETGDSNLFEPCPSDWLECDEVSTDVNKITSQGPQLIEPVQSASRSLDL